MNAKKGILLGVIGLVVLFLVAFGVQAMSMSSENSDLEAKLKAELASHATIDQLQQDLTGMGYIVTPNPDGSLDAVGRTHTIIVYSTHITAHLTFDQDKKNTGYKIDRA